MGRSRHGAQLAVIQPSFRHRGFDSSPTHEQQCRVTLDRYGTGLLPRIRVGSRPRASEHASLEERLGPPARTNCVLPGRAGGAHIHAAVAQPVRATACPAEGNGFESRLSAAPLVDVVQWRGHRPTKPEGAGSTPAVDAPSHQVARRSSGERAPPSEGGRRTFESCRRGPGSEPAG